MKTSYFAKYKGHSGVSIALGTPPWFVGKTYPNLFPSWDLIKEFKEYSDEAAYTKAYYEQVLIKLDPQEVYDDLKDSVLLCWEKSGVFCHRRLVAQWIEDSLGIKVEEY